MIVKPLLKKQCVFSRTLSCTRLNTHVGSLYTHTDDHNSCEVGGTAGLHASHLYSSRNKHAIIIKGGMGQDNISTDMDGD